MAGKRSRHMGQREWIARKEKEVYDRAYGLSRRSGRSDEQDSGSDGPWPAGDDISRQICWQKAEISRRSDGY
jgi:hypothetical protein